MARGNNSQLVNTRLDGLFTHANAFSEVPEGALEEATNVVMRRESLAQPRRGFVDFSNRSSTGLGNFTLTGLGSGAEDRVTDIFEYQNNILVQMDDGGLFFYNSTFQEWQSVDSSSTLPKNPDTENGYFVEAKKASKNFYYTSRRGIRKLDTVAENIALPAGVPRGLAGTAALSGASGFLANDTAVAYRIVWGYVDLNENLILGAPSQRIVISNNSGGSRNVDLTFTIPVGITTNYFYQIYRSSASASAATEPDDELQLVEEANPSAGEISSSEITLTDILPDTLRGADLYTNFTQEGIAQANDQPPAALTLETFRGHLFYGAAVPKASLRLQLIAVGGSDGIQLGDVIEVYVGDGTTPATSTKFTAGSSENIGTNTFQLFTSGTPGQNIQDTATSLSKIVSQRFAINQVDLQAFYNRDPLAVPGEITIRGGTGSFEYRRFAVGLSRPASWLAGNEYASSVGTVTTVTAYGTLSLANFDSVMTYDYKNAISTIEANAIYISKENEPEAVPEIANRILVGTSNDPILRMVSSRDHLFIFKRDEGIYRLSGDVLVNFRVDQHDNTARIIGPRSAVRISNQIYMLSDQGVVAVGNAGVAVVSRPIENNLVEIFSKRENSTYLSSIKAVGYESEREYILLLPDGAPQDNEKPILVQQYVYNIFSDSWTKWEIDMDTATIFDGRIYYGGKNLFGNNSVFIERKDYNASDYADEELTITVNSVSSDGTELTLASVINLGVNWTIEQRQTSSTSTVRGKIKSINLATNVVTLENITGGSFLESSSPSPSVTATYAFEPYPVTIEWVAEDCGNMAMIKRFNEYTFHFEGADFPTGEVLLRSSFTTGYSRTTIRPTFTAVGLGWGSFGWGQAPWGGSVSQNFQQNIRIYSPPEPRLGQWVNVRVYFNQAIAEWSLGGYSVTYKETSTRLRG